MYLQHHGIKGQKWGIRRYQNSDGSYTTAGKERYYKFKNGIKKAGIKIRDFMTDEDENGKRYLSEKGKAAIYASEAALGAAVMAAMIKRNNNRVSKMQDQTILNCRVDEACAKAGVTGELKEQIRKMAYNSWKVKIPENYREINTMSTVSNQLRLI